MFVKTFDHLDFPSDRFIGAERVETEKMRMYRTPEGNLYPSVTSILGCQPKPELEAWVKAVGEKEAAFVSSRAAHRGSHLHNMAEDYLNNRFDPKKVNPIVLQDFLPIKKVLDEHVNNVFHTELQMWSDSLRAAGTADLIAEYDGILSLIDFKTSRRLKYDSDILDYYMQESAYCVMAFERFGIVLKDIITIMMVDGDPRPLVFKKKAVDYLDKFIEVRKLFTKLHGV